MAEKKGKFSALADLHRHAIETDALSEAPSVQPVLLPVVEGKVRGRPATGKRSNPDWKLYSFLLKKQTHRAAVARLHAEQSKRDLSEVIQELLENWLQS